MPQAERPHRTSAPVSALLLAATISAAALVTATAAAGRPVGRFLLSDSPETVVLRYEGFAYQVIPPKIYDLTVFAAGRVVGAIATRGPVEWHLTDEEMAALLDALEATGVFPLTTESIARAHAEWVVKHSSDGGLDVSDLEPHRLVLRLDGYRRTEGMPYDPVVLDITYDNVHSFARRLPEVRELTAYSDAVRLVRELLSSRYPELWR